jgi:predicted nucleic acid-binding protein
VILVDTSVLISYLKGDDSPAVTKMDGILERKMTFGICPHVYLEVLQGAASEEDFDELQEYLGSQVFYTLLDGVASYAKAARMYFELRRKGMTVGSSVDCLIAQTAIDNGLFLLHHDADFDKIARHFPLKVWD